MDEDIFDQMLQALNPETSQCSCVLGTRKHRNIGVGWGGVITFVSSLAHGVGWGGGIITFMSSLAQSWRVPSRLS